MSYIRWFLEDGQVKRSKKTRAFPIDPEFFTLNHALHRDWESYGSFDFVSKNQKSYYKDLFAAVVTEQRREVLYEDEISEDWHDEGEGKDSDEDMETYEDTDFFEGADKKSIRAKKLDIASSDDITDFELEHGFEETEDEYTAFSIDRK